MTNAARPRLLREAGIRFVFALAVLLALGHLFGGRLVETMLPLLRAEIAALDDHYRVLDLRVEDSGVERVVALEVGLARHIVLGGRALDPDPRARARVSTLAGHMLAPAMLCFALAAAWPARRWRDRGPRLAVALPLALAVMLVDLPFVLWGEVWNIHVAALEPERVSPLLLWKDFLQGGGRFALGLVAGAMTVIWGEGLVEPRGNASPPVRAGTGDSYGWRVGQVTKPSRERRKFPVR